MRSAFRAERIGRSITALCDGYSSRFGGSVRAAVANAGVAARLPDVGWMRSASGTFGFGGIPVSVANERDDVLPRPIGVSVMSSLP